jgi:uncharacterized hydrophobic protein (TIGR00271 family)
LALTVGLVGLAFVITGLLEAFEALKEGTFARVIRGLLSAALGGGVILVGQWSTEILLVAVALLLLVRAGFDAYHALLGWGSGDEFWWAALRAAGLVLAAAALLVVGEVAVLVTILGIGTAWVITGGVYLWQVFGPGASARQEADILDTPRTIGAWLQRRDMGEDPRADVLGKLIFQRAEYWRRVSRFAALMGFSAAIAAFGIQADSTAVVIGAMLVAPLMTPIMATSASMLMGWPTRALRSLALVGLGVVIVIGLSFVIARYAPGLVELTANSQITSRTSPTLLDLMIALAAGGAGAYAVSRPDVSDSLPGVAIAVALVPPLAVVGITLSAGEFGLAAGALLLFLTNLVGIILASGIVFVMVGFLPWSRMEANRAQLQRSMLTVVTALLIIMVPLALTGERILESAADRDDAVGATEVWLEDEPGLELLQLDLDQGEAEVVVAGPGVPDDVGSLADGIAAAIGRDVEVNLKVIPERRFAAESGDG